MESIQIKAHIMVQTQSEKGMNRGHGSGKKGKKKLQKRCRKERVHSKVTQKE